MQKLHLKSVKSELRTLEYVETNCCLHTKVRYYLKKKVNN